MLPACQSKPYGILARAINAWPAILVLIAALFVPFAAKTADDSAGSGQTPILFAFGDSLTAGYGLAPGEGFTDQLADALHASGRNVRVVNAGVSGDTSASARARLDWALDSLKARPALAIVELGANDALRGLEPRLTRANLAAIIEALDARGIPVLLAGMLAPPNMGRDYEAEFNAIFPDLAGAYGAAFYPFFLDGVAAAPKLNQADGIHPNAKGVAVIVERMLPVILPLLPKDKATH